MNLREEDFGILFSLGIVGVLAFVNQDVIMFLIVLVLACIIMVLGEKFN